MPFIKVKTSCPISKEQEITLKSRMGKAIELVPGKSEEYLLLEFEDNSRLWLRGENTVPIVYIEAAIFGNESHPHMRLHLFGLGMSSPFWHMPITAISIAPFLAYVNN